MRDKLKTTIKALLNELSSYSGEAVNELTTGQFIDKMKTEVGQYKNHFNNDKILSDQLEELADYKTFDELPFLTRLFHKLVVGKYQPYWMEDWSKKGKYLNDLHFAELKLKGVLYKLNEPRG